MPPAKNLTVIQKQMISNFQCPGCTCGPAPVEKCPSFKPQIAPGEGFECKNHSAGTLLMGLGYVYLGMPKGFNRVGSFLVKGENTIPNPRSHNIRLWDIMDEVPDWGHLNVPVWAMEKDDYLFVRTYLPRVNRNFIDVIKGGTLADIPVPTIDVADFYDDID